MSHRDPRIGALGVAGTVLVLTLARSCACVSAETETTPVDGGTATTSVTTSTTSPTASTTSSGTGGTGGDAGVPPPSPCPDWPGWETWDDFAPECPLCVPASKDALPPPIEWEPCAPEAKMPVGCRQMKTDWPWYSTPFAYSATVDVDQNGKAMLDLIRVSQVGPKPWRMKIVADADGPVRSAILDPRGPGIKGCTYTPDLVVSMSGGKHITTIVDGDLAEQYPQAAVGGPVDELHPKVQWSWESSVGRILAASDAVWATTDGFNIGVAAWGQPLATVYTSAQSGGLQQVGPRAFHELVTWTSGNGAFMGVMAWTPDQGAYPFITFPGDWTRGVDMLGTDGKHMVWMYGEGRSQPLDPYDSVSVMASPFTTDPAKLEPKRLRSFPTSYMVAPWIVGCGYAANEYDPGRVLIVRISDGWSWELTDPDPTAPPLAQWHFGTVFGLSCEEIYLRAGVGLAMNVARVRLDALGAGMPPD